MDTDTAVLEIFYKPQFRVFDLWPSELHILENDCGACCGVVYEKHLELLDPIGKKNPNNND